MRTRVISAVLSFSLSAGLAAEQYRDPVDGMPILGNRLPELERRVKELEDRLSSREPALAPVPAPVPVLPGSPVPRQLWRGDTLLKEGNLDLAAESYRGALRDSLNELTAADQSIADSFLACFKAAQFADAAQKAGKTEVARSVGQQVVQALQTYQQVAPEWNPKIVAYRLKQTERLLAELK